MRPLHTSTIAITHRLEKERRYFTGDPKHIHPNSLDRAGLGGEAGF